MIPARAEANNQEQVRNMTLDVRRFAMRGPAATVTINGQIVAADVDKLQTALRAVQGQPVALYINSPGGDSWAGAAMAALVEEHGDVTGIGMGLVASAATSVFCACRPAILHHECVMMIHDPAAMVFGNPAQLRDSANRIDQIADVYARSLAKRSGHPVPLVRKWMVDETWLSPEDAMALGFADEVVGGPPEPPAEADYTAFRHAPERLVRMAVEKGWAKVPVNQKGEADA